MCLLVFFASTVFVNSKSVGYDYWGDQSASNFDWGVDDFNQRQQESQQATDKLYEDGEDFIARWEREQWGKDN